MSLSIAARMDVWLVTRTDSAIARAQERMGVSLPLVQAWVVLAGAAAYWVMMITLTVQLGGVLPRWATIACTTAFLGFATLVTAKAFAKRISIHLRDARGEWTDAKHQTYVKAAIFFRLTRIRVRFWACLLTVGITVGALAGLGGGIFAWVCAAAVIEELSLCAFPRQPKKDEATSETGLAAGHA